MTPRGGAREGAGRPPRTEPKARPIWCGQIPEEDRRLILETLTPEERYEALMDKLTEKEKTMIDFRTALADTARDAANQVFIQSYINDENRERYQREGLGIRISQWLRWDGLAVMEVFRAALEDANFHTEAAVVQGWIEGEEAE